jgi:RHS repeat-associated protein
LVVVRRGLVPGAAFGTFAIESRANGTVTQPYSTLFPELPNSPSQNFNPTIVSQILIPDGIRSYTFTYNSYGELKRMVVPTGGAFEYDFGPGPTATQSGIISPGGNTQIYRRLVQRRLFSDAAGSLLTGRTVYSAANSGADTAVAETISDAAGNTLKQITHTLFGQATNPASYAPNPNTTFGYTPWRESLEYQTALSGPNRLVATQFNQSPPTWWSNTSDSAPINAPQVNIVTTTLQDTGDVAQRRILYDPFNNPTDIYDTDYGAGGPGKTLRHVSRGFIATNQVVTQTFDYTCAGTQTCPPGQTLILHTRRLPFRDIVWQLDQSGNDAGLLSETDYAYDQQQVTDCPSITGHDSNLPASVRARGNLTGTRQYLFPSGHRINRSSVFDIAGNITTQYEPLGGSRLFVFADKYGNPDGSLSDTSSPPELAAGNQTCAFASQTFDLLGYSRIFQRDYYTGNIVDQSDPNNVISTTYFKDPLERPTQAIRSSNQAAARTQSTFVYDDTNHKITTTEDQSTYGDNVIKTVLIYDGIGQTINTLEYEDSVNFITRTTVYDALGRVTQKSNPYRATDTPIYSVTLYDALDRAVTINETDSAQFSVSWVGNQATSQDPAGKITRAIYDPLGRLTQVIEDPFNSNFSTTYFYDPNSNLTGVSQGVQVRSFVYDSASRLISETHPENGSTTYTYDDDNNLLSKVDARGITTTLAYDVGNRLTAKTYTDSTPAVSFIYDDPSVLFSVERLTAVNNSVAARKVTNFDPLGRVLGSIQLIDGLTFSFGYAYGLDGSLTSETYPTGRIVKYSYDAAARPIRIDSGSQNGYYISSVQYAAHGPESQINLGNGLIQTLSYNKRLQPTTLSLGTLAAPASIWQLGNTFQSSPSSTDNNGNVLGQTLTVPGLSQPYTTPYGYDGLNRLTQAVETSGSSTVWSQTFVYDRYGNKALQLPSYIPTGSSATTSLSSYDSNSNRIVVVPYDGDGNLTNDQVHAFTYDAECRITSSVSGVVATGISYDGFGLRVKKASAGASTYYAYDGFLRLAVEQSTSNPSDLSGTNFLTMDHLGSTRVVTDSSSAPKVRYDFLPFGDLIESIGGRAGVAGYGDAGALTEKFTGKERDPESKLDFFLARYFNFSDGRFVGSDQFELTKLPSGANHLAIRATLPYSRTQDPRTLNRYAYIGGNPLNRTDPMGHSPSNAVNSTVTVMPARRSNSSYLRPAPPKPSTSLVTAVRDVASTALVETALEFGQELIAGASKGLAFGYRTFGYDWDYLQGSILGGIKSKLGGPKIGSNLGPQIFAGLITHYTLKYIFSEGEKRQVSDVPFWSDLPLIGEFFSSVPTAQ